VDDALRCIEVWLACRSVGLSDWRDGCLGIVLTAPRPSVCPVWARVLEHWGVAGDGQAGGQCLSAVIGVMNETLGAGMFT
jgi:hypothetical protein